MFTQGRRWRVNLGLEVAIPLGLNILARFARHLLNWQTTFTSSFYLHATITFRRLHSSRLFHQRPSAFALPSAPTGLCPKARGCEARATLGHCPQKFPTATRLRPYRSVHPCEAGHNAVGVATNLSCSPKVGAGAPTLGWRSQSRWD
jgi:hypothetical protein